MSSDNPIIFGISASSHDAAAAIFAGGVCIAALEEEKLSRVRRSHGLPQMAIQFCLAQARIAAHHVKYVAVARPMRDRARGAQLAETWMPGWLRQEFPNAQVMLVDHHDSHAAAAYYPSSFQHAIILTLDEAGDGKTASVSYGNGLKIEAVAESTFPDSLGNLVSRVANLIGFASFGDEHKLQWLSTAGAPRFADVFSKILKPRSGSVVNFDQSYLAPDAASKEAARGGFSEKFFAECGLHETNDLSDEERADLAASIQFILNETVTAIGEKYAGQGKSGNLCLGGGVALNSLLIAHLEESGKFQSVFAHPAAGNAGNAMGAALHVAHSILELEERTPLENLFLGPEFSDEAIKEVLENCKLSFHYLPQSQSLIAEAIRVLREDKILGWFQGRAEFGPRSLGNRCILASPLGKYVNDNLNHYVKHREKFRPFAASVPLESAGKFFEFTDSARFLTSVGKVKEKYLRQFAGNVLASSDPTDDQHAEQRIRVQIVERDNNRYFWELLNGFGEATGVPVLFNTSFNLFGEPLVCSPRDAVRSFYCSGIDHLMIGPFSLSK